MEKYIERLSTVTKPNHLDAKRITSADIYYNPECHLSTHEALINDHHTLEIFKNWIKNNSDLIKDKIVLDIGCGTGILSMLAAKAGARRVISIESSSIAAITNETVKENNLHRTITIITGKVNEIKQLPFSITKVDVIISMWIGYSLLQGDRLKQVILARDKWLRKGGIIIPDQARLSIAAISDDDYRENNLEWWKNVYGYDMSSVVDDYIKYPSYCVVPITKLVTDSSPVLDVNLRNVTYEQILKGGQFQLSVRQNDYVQGFCTFFNVRFSGDEMKNILDTHPRLAATHWGHACFYMRDYFIAKKKEKIMGTCHFFNISGAPRYLGVIIGLIFKGQLSSITAAHQYVLRP